MAPCVDPEDAARSSPEIDAIAAIPFDEITH
jgi:hypothetical protein